MSTVQHTALLLTQRAPAFAHVLRAKRRFAVHPLATVAALPAALDRYAPSVILVDLRDAVDLRTPAVIRATTALPLIGIVDAVGTEPAVAPHDVDALLVRTAPVEQWAIQIDAARTRAAARRSTLCCDDLIIDLTNRTVHRGTTRVKMSAKLWQLLHMLAHHAPHPVPRAQIARAVWNSTDVSAFAGMNMAVKRLRERLGGSQYIEAGDGFIRLAVTPEAPHPPTASAPAPATPALIVAVPAPVTPFIGRAAERAKLRHLLDQHTRVITLLGSAGVGKTRLAVQIARDVQDLFSMIIFLKLDDLTTVEQVLVRLAHILGMPADSSSLLVPNVCTRLRQHTTLLIVDNAEHLIADVAMLVAQLLHDAAPLAVLATSREPLDIYGEQHFAMHPLSLAHVKLAYYEAGKQKRRTRAGEIRLALVPASNTAT